ncbi:hypothetical protein AB4125_07545 [Vibrio splendidus]
MQLVSLYIRIGENIIREVQFKDGINIITNSGTDGNQIGKSTTLRAIKFCLGSDGTNLWHDPDSEVTNTKIFDLLVSGAVSFELNLNIDGKPINIIRTLHKKTSQISRISWINGKKYSYQNRFKTEVCALFGHLTSKPSFSTIQNRFFRLDKKSVNKIYRYNNAFTSNDDYRLIYSHLFGFLGHNELQKDLDLKAQIISLETRKTSLLNGNTEIEYKDKLVSIDENIQTLVEKEDLYDIRGIQNNAILKVRSCREKIAYTSSEITDLETRVLYNKKTISDYEAKITHIDSGVVASIYSEAKALIPNLSSTFEEAVNFHNSMFKKKAEYVAEQTEVLNVQLNKHKISLNQLLNTEKQLFKDIINESHLGGFILIEREIQEQREERGKFSYVIDEVNSIDTEIAAISSERRRIQVLVRKYMSDFINNLSTFNISCKSITKKVFKDFSIYFNTPEDKENSVNFTIINNEKVLGDGSPRAASMAVDMAFVEYAKATGAKMPLFTLQDYLEPTDEDKLSALFYLANTRKIQTVVAILNDKLQLLDSEFLRDNTVLTLSSSDKFFKV